MNRTTYLLAGFVTWASVACVTELTGAGQQVRIGKQDPADGCTELGTVYGSSTGGGYASTEDKMTSAENELRNRAAEKGANYVVMDAIGSGLPGMTISGRAFRCDRLPSNLAPAANAAAGVVAPAGDPETRLRKLKELLEKGLITQDDYDRRRAEILQSL
jgi:Domain of unknown function (DUF4156)/Short C-terminal domain